MVVGKRGAGSLGYGGGGAARWGGRGRGEIAQRPNHHALTPPTTFAGHPTVWRSVAASAPGNAFKKPRISRAKRSTATPCSAAADGLPYLLHRLLYLALHLRRNISRTRWKFRRAPFSVLLDIVNKQLHFGYFTDLRFNDPIR